MMGNNIFVGISIATAIVNRKSGLTLNSNNGTIIQKYMII